MIEKLFPLIGTWKGDGTAKFPTIKTVEYMEKIEFSRIGTNPVIFYEQKTWYLLDGNRGGDLHHESGYINVKEDGNYEVSNSQDNGRVEVLTAKIIETGDSSIHLSMESKLFGNDERMDKTIRDYYITGRTMRYELKMATKNTPEMQGHLEAILNKI